MPPTRRAASPAAQRPKMPSPRVTGKHHCVATKMAAMLSAASSPSPTQRAASPSPTQRPQPVAQHPPPRSVPNCHLLASQAIMITGNQTDGQAERSEPEPQPVSPTRRAASPAAQRLEMPTPRLPKCYLPATQTITAAAIDLAAGRTTASQSTAPRVNFKNRKVLVSPSPFSALR